MESKYNVLTSKLAYLDVEEAADYMVDQLMSPQAADKFINSVEKIVQSLENMPDRRPLCQDTLLNKKGRRFIPVGNYDIIYSIDEVSHTVYVGRIFYDKMNRREYL